MMSRPSGPALTEARQLISKIERTAEVWSVGNDLERLIATTIDEAIDEYLEEIHPNTPDSTLTLYGYAPMEVSRDEICRPLELMIDGLDEEYGDQDGYEESTITHRMKQCEGWLIDAVLADYEPFACEEVEVVKVRLTGPKGDEGSDWEEIHE